jgi:hypothetical protein
LVDRDAYASDALAMVLLVRSQAMVIVHDRTGWTVAARD